MKKSYITLISYNKQMGIKVISIKSSQTKQTVSKKQNPENFFIFSGEKRGKTVRATGWRAGENLVEMGLGGAWNDTSSEILRPVSWEATKPSSETALMLVFRESLLDEDSGFGKEIRVENTPSVVEAAICFLSKCL